MLFLDECANSLVGFFDSLFEVVVDDDAVELRSLRQLELSACDALLYHLRSVSSTTNKTAAQLLNRWRLNEQTQRAIAVILLDVATALHVDVEHHVLAARSLRLHLLLQRAVEAVLVNLLVLEKLVAADALAELLGSDEEILYAVLLCATRSTRCARDREGEVQLRALHQTIDDCALSAATRSGEYYKFTHVLSFEF